MMTPILATFDLMGAYFMPHHDLIDPLFLQRKVRLSLSHLFPEVLGTKAGMIYYQLVLFNCFLVFCINFLLDFRSN